MNENTLPPATAPYCAAPDRHPRPPRVVLPTGACDTHAHVCGPARDYAYDARRIYTPPDAPLPDYLRMLQTQGVSRAVLVQPSVYGEDNRALCDALARVGAGLRGVAVIALQADVTVIRTLHAAGVRGVRFNLVDRHDARNVVPRDDLMTLARLIAPFGWHIELLVNLDESDVFSDAVAALPVPVVVGHMGYPRGGAGAWRSAPGLRAMVKLMESGRLWVKLTGPYRISAAPDLPYEDVEPVVAILREAAPQRLLWGTDWPHVMMKKPMPNEGNLTDLLARWLPEPALRAQVLVTNPQTLYGFAADETIDYRILNSLKTEGGED